MLPTRRLASLALAIALALAAPAKADPVRLSTDFSDEGPTAHAPAPRPRASLEGRAGRLHGARGRTAPRPKHAADFDLHLGMRPHVGAVAIDLADARGLSRVGASCCGTVALGLDRKLGMAAVGGALRFDPGEAITRAEARAAVTLGRRTRISGALGGRYDPNASGSNAEVSIDLGASRPLGPAWLDLRLTEASYSPRPGGTDDGDQLLTKPCVASLRRRIAPLARHRLPPKLSQSPRPPSWRMTSRHLDANVNFSPCADSAPPGMVRANVGPPMLERS